MLLGGWLLALIGFAAGTYFWRRASRLNAQLIRARAPAPDARTAPAKTDLLAELSHELRTPLNAIIGFADAIGHEIHGPVGSAKYIEYANDIKDSGRHLLELVNGILDLAKIGARKLALRPEPIAIPDIVEETVRILRHQIDAAGLTMSSNLAADLPHLLADRRAMRQVMLNLLSNATKFTLSGGRIDVTAGIAPNGWLKLSVRDSGIGIRQEDIAKALQPYEQIESEIPRRHDGTGLGLPISRELVVLQGGEFSLASTPGEGTTVMMRFPPERLVNLPVQLDLPGHGDGKLPAA